MASCCEFPSVITSLVTFLWAVSIFNKTSVVSGSQAARTDASAVNISYILNSFQVGYDRRVRKQSTTKSIICPVAFQS